MKVLFFDATQEWIHVATFKINIETLKIELICEFLEYLPRESSFRLVEEIQKALLASNWEKPNVILVLTGPGSFTGIRITVTTGRNLSQLWKIPVMGIDSLEAYCYSFISESSVEQVIIALDGKQSKRYFGRLTQLHYSGSSDFREALILKEMNIWSKFNSLFVYSGESLAIFPENAIKIEATLPKSMPLLKRVKEVLLQLNYEISNYTHLAPNYIRGTYVETNNK